MSATAAATETEIDLRPTPTPIPYQTVEYNFKNSKDFLFYILNAVCHDWIHDFNSYDRLAKILEEISKLITSYINATQTVTGGSHKSNVTKDNKSRNETSDEFYNAVGGNGDFENMKTQVDNLIMRVIQDSSLTDDEKLLTIKEEIKKNIDPHDNSESHLAAHSGGQPNAYDFKRNYERSFIVKKNESLRRLIERIYERELPTRRRVEQARDSAEQQTMDIGDNSGGDEIISDNGDIMDVPDLSGVTVTDLSGVIVPDLFKGQLDLYMIVGPSPTPSSPKTLVNDAINNYNNFKTVQDYSMRSSTITKLEILQKIEDFIGEIKLLIISKINSPKKEAEGMETGDADESKTGSEDEENRPPSIPPSIPSSINLIKDDDIIRSIKSIRHEIYDTIIDIEFDILLSLDNDYVSDNQTIQNYLEKLDTIFNFILELFKQFNIPGISSLERFNNSIIEDALTIVILNQCNYIDIVKESELYLTNLFLPKTISLSETTLTGFKRGRSESFTDTDTTNTPRDEIDSSNYTPEIIESDSLNDSQMNDSQDEITSISSDEDTPRYKLPRYEYEGEGGAKFSQKDFREMSQESHETLERRITVVEGTILFRLYKGDEEITEDTNISDIYTQYTTFISEIDSTIKIITGPQLYNSQTRQIENRYSEITGRTRDKLAKMNHLVDLIIKFVFDQIIAPYHDIQSRLKITISPSGPSSGTPSASTPDGKSDKPGPPSLSKDQVRAVQQISRLVAFKVLELTDCIEADSSNYFGTPTFNIQPNLIDDSDSDLYLQASILHNLLKDPLPKVQPSGVSNIYTEVDDLLINYFMDRYGKGPNFLLGMSKVSNTLIPIISQGKRESYRLINNAIPQGTIKDSITNIVVCPTSSVCDAMGSFGSCANPKGKEEYYNMDFFVSASGDSNNNFYTGKTVLKNNKKAVNITYGIKCGRLEIYNFIDMNISTRPVNLELTNSFKGVINRIIEIWKSDTGSLNIEELWKKLYFNSFVLSIIKVGSQKAVGDIFQEINSTLSNGGYDLKTGINLTTKTTFGFMGDRPSGVRVIKLLKDALNPGKILTNVYGGFIGKANALIYYQVTGQAPSQVPRGTKGRKGGKKTLKKRKNKRYTNKQKNNINKTNKNRKNKAKKTRKY